MKFRVKMTLCMLSLLSVLFGAGGSLLIAESFQSSLEREKSAAFASCRTVWSVLQIVNGLDSYLDAEAIVQAVDQLYVQDQSAWAGLRLSAGSGELYSAGLTEPLAQAEQVASGECLFRVAQGRDGALYLLLSSAVEASGEVLRLQTAHEITDLYSLRRTQQRVYVRVFGGMVLLCAVFAYTISKVLTAPLTGLSQTSRAIASGDFSSRVAIRSGDEVGAVGEDFNVMAARMEETVDQLRQAMERQERFMGSFAHELKTPMTALIGYAELLRSGTLTEGERTEAAGYIYSESKRLESLSKKLLELLVLRQGELPLSEVSPAELAMELAERLGPLYEAQGIALTCRGQEGLCRLEPDLVWSLLLNLVDNARKAVEPGGHISLEVEMMPDGCRFLVSDDGRGVPPQAMEHLTEAFYRVDKARSRKQGGFGLGLALCQEIAALHHGSIRFENRTDGTRGTRVTVELRGGRS